VAKQQLLCGGAGSANTTHLANTPPPRHTLTHTRAQVLLSATEAAEMILRVDEIIRCAPRQRQ
jgi:hypothetical protein